MKSFIHFAVLLLTCEMARGADDAVLHLTNGGFVTGRLQGSDDARTLRWQSPLFTRALDFALDGVNGVHYPVPVTLPKPSGEYCFELAGGDVLFGSLVKLTDETAELEVARFGRLHLRRDHIRRLYRWQGAGADLIYLGPNGLAGWEGLADKKQWTEEGGQPRTDQPGAWLFANFGIPAQAVIEFELSWKVNPDFVLALGVDEFPKTADRAFSFEVWDQELVALRDTNQISDVASVQDIVSGAGRTHLVAYLDQEQGRLLVFSPGGTQLADLKVGLKKPRAFGGVRLTNKAGDVRLERLRISRWNGVPPLEVQANKSRLHQTDGSILYGQVAAFNSVAKQFIVRDGQRETKVPADQIASVFLSPPDDSPQRAFRTVYQDGTQLSGELTRVADDHLRLTSPGIQEPLRLPLAELRSLVVLQHEVASVAAASDGQAGMLELDGVRLRGRLINGREQPDASCLVWQPDQSATASPLRPDAAGRIVYREPPPPPKPVRPVPQQQPQALGVGGVFMKLLTGSQPPVAQAAAVRRSLHLRSGDTIPCDVIKIDEQGLTIKTTLSDATFVPHDKIKAVELAVLPNSLKLSKSKRERLLTLPRMQKDSPPTQLICSKNGDFLRGRVLGMDDKSLHLEVRLETKEVARDRIAQIIWLHGDELIDSTSSEHIGERGAVRPPVDGATPNDRGPDGTPLATKATPTRVQALRSDGIRLTFASEQLADKILSGTSDVLGACRADLSHVDVLLIGRAIEQAAANLTYHKWKLHNATEPKFAQSDDGQPPADRIPGSDSPLVGKPAPDFQLELLGAGGKKFHLADQKGKIVVLDFWATWCGPCLQAMPQVDRVVHEFADQGVQLIAVNLEESPKQITSALERHKLNMTVALDIDGVVATKYAATAIPQTVIIDRTGNVARLFVGGGPHLGDQLRDAIQGLLSGGASSAPAP